MVLHNFVLIKMLASYKELPETHYCKETKRSEYDNGEQTSEKCLLCEIIRVFEIELPTRKSDEI